MTKFRILTLVAVLSLATTVAAAQPRAGLLQSTGELAFGGPALHGRLLAALDLSAEQQAAAKALREEMAVEAAPTFEQHRAEMAAIEALLDTGAADPTEVGQKLIAAHETRQQLEALHEELVAKLTTLLDAEQLEKFQQLQETQREAGIHFRLPR